MSKRYLVTPKWLERNWNIKDLVTGHAVDIAPQISCVANLDERAMLRVAEAFEQGLNFLSERDLRT